MLKYSFLFSSQHHHEKEEAKIFSDQEYYRFSKTEYEFGYPIVVPEPKDCDSWHSLNIR